MMADDGRPADRDRRETSDAGEDASTRPGGNGQRALPRRFYRAVRVSEEGPPFGVLLDGHDLKTPLKRPFNLPTRALAEAVADEWRMQQTRIAPLTMPLTRLCNAAIDRVKGRRAAVIADIADIAAHDMLCYRADHPAELARRQEASWTPPLRWAEREMDVRLLPVTGVMPVDQPRDALRNLRRALEALDDFTLAAVSAMAGLSGSAILALAVANGAVEARTAWRLANLEEDWNIAHWGADAEAMARRRGKERDFMTAARLSRLLTTPNG